MHYPSSKKLLYIIYYIIIWQKFSMYNPQWDAWQTNTNRRLKKLLYIIYYNMVEILHVQSSSACCMVEEYQAGAHSARTWCTPARCRTTGARFLHPPSPWRTCAFCSRLQSNEQHIKSDFPYLESFESCQQLESRVPPPL